MAAKTGTYTLIASNTLSGGETSFTFSSIPSTYTDLILVFGSFQGTTNYSFSLRFNGDTNTNYSYTVLEGNGTSASSSRSSNVAGWYNGAVIGFPDSKSNAIFHIMDYANTTTYKTGIGRYNYLGTGLPGAGTSVGLWRNTSAINSITVFLASGSFTAGGTAKLYGIEAGNL